MDIVERLRREEDALDNEAADEIERLRETIGILAVQSKDNLNKKDDEIERLREALKRIGEGDTCISLMTHPPICKRAYDARSALQQKETE